MSMSGNPLWRRKMLYDVDLTMSKVYRFTVEEEDNNAPAAIEKAQLIFDRQKGNMDDYEPIEGSISVTEIKSLNRYSWRVTNVK